MVCKLGDFKDIEVTFPEATMQRILLVKQRSSKLSCMKSNVKTFQLLTMSSQKTLASSIRLKNINKILQASLLIAKNKKTNRRVKLQSLKKHLKSAEIDIPDAMVESETSFMLRDFENRLRQQGMNLELYFQFSGQDEAALRSQMSGDAVKRVRNNLVLEAIAKAESISADDSDLNEELENLSKQYNRPAEELRSIFTENGNLDNIKEDLVLRKTIKFLLDNSKAETVVA